MVFNLTSEKILNWGKETSSIEVLPSIKREWIQTEIHVLKLRNSGSRKIRNIEMYKKHLKNLQATYKQLTEKRKCILEER